MIDDYPSEPVDNRNIQKKSFEEFEEQLTESDYLDFFNTLDDEDQGNFIRALYQQNKEMAASFSDQMYKFFNDQYKDIDSYTHPDMFYNEDDYQ